jgi:hypothetical protein
MAAEPNKPVYYDGSGIIQLPPGKTVPGDIIIKPTNVNSAPVPIPYFPYLPYNTGRDEAAARDR